MSFWNKFLGASESMLTKIFSGGMQLAHWKKKGLACKLQNKNCFKSRPRKGVPKMNPKKRATLFVWTMGLKLGFQNCFQTNPTNSTPSPATHGLPKNDPRWPPHHTANLTPRRPRDDRATSTSWPQRNNVNGSRPQGDHLDDLKVNTSSRPRGDLAVTSGIIGVWGEPHQCLRCTTPWLF